MRVRISVLIVIAFLFTGVSEGLKAQGIIFEKSGYEEVRKQAKENGKLIFIDFYTTWCGPCKSLSKNVFTQKEVGDYFNSHFLCLKIDAEREGKELAKKYDVSSFPTMIFLNDKGEVVNRIVGLQDAPKLIAKAKDANTGLDNPNSMINLKKRYVSGERNEAFLKRYIDELILNREDPSLIIEEYLGVQKSMKESSSKMMEFLLNNGDFLVVGGNAERIYVENKDVYMAIATSREEKNLTNLYYKMLRKVQQAALKNKDAKKYELFIDRWVKLSKRPPYQDYNDLCLDLLLIKDEKAAYQKKAIVYLDSIVSSRSIEEIRETDRKLCRENAHRFYFGDSSAYVNITANRQISAIEKIGNELMNSSDRIKLKHFTRWIEHGKILIPGDYRIYNFEANLMYRYGKKEKAIEMKENVLSLITKKDKVYPYIEEGLQKMKDGTF